ncbi:hypothetical protein KPL71_008713 [Citrus sinensis]|uniref:Uncharacterized protein n=1 Tax=Citrus sinensis TaxID=2711 RepID=A0ACB8M875_CITSI|nr:hypothetical protein KPL71_008713 [Citrus sinensis]
MLLAGKFQSNPERRRAIFRNMGAIQWVTFEVSTSWVLKHKISLKCKNPGSPTISCSIGNHTIENALLDLGNSVNLVSYSVFVKFGLGELHPTPVVLQLADWFTKISRSIMEDMLIQVDKFYFPVDFIVIDTQSIQDSRKHIPIILCQPFLATADAHIQCKTGNMQLSFDNMTMHLKIFNIAKLPHNADDEIVNVDLIETLVDNTFLSNLSNDHLQTCLIHFGLDFDIDRSVDEVNALLDSALSMDTNKCKSKVEQLAPSEKKLVPSSESPLKLELKLLPNNLEYAFLGEESTLPVIISSSLNDEQKDVSLKIGKRTNTPPTFRTTFKAPIRMSPYRLVYGKACHIPMELKHRAYWAIKKFNFDMQQASSERRLHLAELEEIRNDAYKNAKIYKQRMKVFHDKQILRKSFTPSQKMLVFNSRLHLFSGMDRNEILVKLHNRFLSLPQNALLTIYKARSEHMRLLMRNNTPADIRWLIKAKVQLAATSNKQFKNICALSGFNYGKHKEFIEAAIDLDRMIAERKLHLVYGGGDLATLEALITLAFWAHMYIHQKLIGLLNVNNFYDGFIAFLNHTIKNYFIPSTVKKLLICVHTANELLDLLQAYGPELDPGTFVLECPNNDGNSSRHKEYKLDLIIRL